MSQIIVMPWYASQISLTMNQPTTNNISNRSIKSHEKPVQCALQKLLGSLFVVTKPFLFNHAHVSWPHSRPMNTIVLPTYSISQHPTGASGLNTAHCQTAIDSLQIIKEQQFVGPGASVHVPGGQEKMFRCRRPAAGGHKEVFRRSY